MARIAYRLRTFEEGDRHFVSRGWASEMRRAEFSRHVPPAVYWPCQHEMIRRILEVSTTLIACDPNDPSHLYGCIVLQGEPPIMHWLYVKGPYRRLGLATELVTQTIGDRRPIFCSQAPPIFHSRETVERFELVYCHTLLLGILPPMPFHVAPSESPDPCPTPNQ